MSLMPNGADAEDQASLLSIRSVKPTPDTITKLVKRLRAMTLTLLPVEVDPESINDPTSRVITPQVIAAYRAAAGDFNEALPYCLLRARAEFMWDANHNPADYGENYSRAVACEVLARRIVHQAPTHRLTSIMSARFKHRQVDGDESEMASALEMAIDSHCTIFLSSTEAQAVVSCLWRGDWVQKNNEHHDIDYVPYDAPRATSIWGRLDAARMNVPRYQNIFRITVWLFFLFVYSQAVREPLEKLDPNHDMAFDEWEVALYLLALSFCIEDLHKFFKLLRFVTYRAFSFWNFIAFVTDSLLIAAFALRVVGLREENANPEHAVALRLKSFQVLSFVSPFIWMKLITVFDGYKYIGTMQICVARMLQESGIFFALLSVLALGFGQGLYALDAADGEIENPSTVVNLLVQALLQSPNYDKFSESPAGLTLYYFWNLVTAVILLNVLISLFSSAYSEVVDNAEAHYLAFFAGKTVGMIRAPDTYVYPAPFNLIEVVLVAPFEMLPCLRLSFEIYAKLNKVVMTVVFFIPLTVIALYESVFRTSDKNSWMKNLLRGMDEGDPDAPENRDPEIDTDDVAEGDEGLVITRHKFSELVKVFPNTEQSSEATILAEIRELRVTVEALMEELMKRLEKAEKA